MPWHAAKPLKEAGTLRALKRHTECACYFKYSVIHWKGWADWGDKGNSVMNLRIYPYYMQKLRKSQVPEKVLKDMS